MKELQRQIIFGDREFMDLSKDQGLAGLQTLLGLPSVPKRIEGYDISHMSGTNNVASMVVSTNGLADKAQYRKFKLLIPGNNDFAHMNEALSRRFSGRHSDWQTPDLLLIDGGKGQLTAALDALEAAGMKIPVVGLAKREEEIVVHVSRSNVTVNIEGIKAWAREKNPFKEPTAMPLGGKALEGKYIYPYVQDGYEPGLITENEEFIVIKLPKSSHIVKLLQRIRDESHRFAVSYHSTLKRKAATHSILDNIPGVGPVTRKKLVTTFGSGRAVVEATQQQLEATLGPRVGKTVYNWLHTQKT
jgi:excinuclease ABC subunit C